MKRKDMLAMGLILLILVAGLAACGERPTDQVEPTDGPGLEPTEAAPAPTEEGESAPTTEPGETITTDSGLKFVPLEEGTGPTPQPGEVVVVHYRGTLEDGTEFDNSYDRGEPARFALGATGLIPGWEEGVSMMKAGGKARLIIPPELGYGSEGAGGIIPPDATLIFEVELLDIEEGSPDDPAEVAPDDYVVTDSGLKYYDLEEGEGSPAESGEVVTVHYTGWLEDGAKFDSSIDRGRPLSFSLGAGMIIPGWDEGVTGMKVGGKRQIVIPPELAYGSEGAGGVIPPDTTIILDVEMVDITPGSPDAPAEVDPDEYVVTDSGLKYYDLVEGDGAEAEPGQTVLVHYTGWLEDGTKFDSSLDRGQPFTFVLGSGQVIAGWDEGVAGMKVGGRRQLVIPADLGYGAQGSGGTIPPNATLIFDVELTGIE